MKTEFDKSGHSAIGGKNSTFYILHSTFLSAFTLVELMIAVGLFSLVVAGSIGVYIMCQKMWRATSLSMDTARMASMALERMVYGLGTNSGLRSAYSIIAQTNAGGHPFVITNAYWNTGIGPPAADNPVHYTHVGCSYGFDGSWRLTLSNTLEGVKYIDYNVKQRNILFCPDTNQTSAARAQRVLICNYVSDARVVTNTEGVSIALTVWKKDGMFVASNQVSTYVKKRNE